MENFRITRTVYTEKGTIPMTEKRIRHRIERHEKKLKRLEAIGSSLSKAGHWSKGYEDGALSVLYELLDEIEEGVNNHDRE